MAKARAVVQVGDKKFAMQQFELPHIGADDALMRIEACGICGSDVDQYDGKLNGPGTVPFANGTKYVGTFTDNKLNGQGTATYLNGDQYDGMFKDNQRG